MKKANNKKLLKSSVIEQIREARVHEELAIPLYAGHITQALFWSGLAKEKQTLIIAGLKTLQRESQEHIRYLKRVEKIYLKSLK